MRPRWPALKCATVEPALRASWCWALGGMTRSFVPTRYQLGCVRHAAAVAGSFNAPSVIGFCVAHSVVATFGASPVANEARNVDFFR